MPKKDNTQKFVIPDKEFKALQHICKGFECHLSGQQLEKGYKPDFVLKNKNEYLILESENCSSRKTFVGGLIKAAHFLQNEKKGVLFFIIVPKPNTTADAIAKHLKPYLQWMQDKTNLKDVFVIETKHYYVNKKVLPLSGSNFKKLAFKV